MKRPKTPTFIAELPLVVSEETQRQLSARLLSGARLYNTGLGEALRRLDLMRQSKAWQAARKLKAAERTEAFKALVKQFDFTSASISSFATECKNSAGWKSRLSAHETQKLAETAFSAAEQYSFGKRGRPRFKNARRPLKSFSGKSADSSIRYRRELGVVEWAGLVMPVLYPPVGKDLWLDEALQADTKFCRLVWRNLRGQRRWYVQLAQSGLSPLKLNNTTQAGCETGLDVGPSTVAIVSESDADLVAFCPAVDSQSREIRRLQRAMDRSRRATNPQCYHDDGTWKRGEKVTVVSRHYLDLKQEVAEKERKLAAGRKCSQGQLGNDVLRLGNVIKTEKLSYQAWQKRYGKSVKAKAPGMFIEGLRRKAERAGGELIELPTWKLKMSQYDHVSGDYQKKRLGERWHVLGRVISDGALLIQRDCYSAYLALCVVNNEHQPSRLKERWPIVKPLLARADWCRKIEVASGETLVLPTVLPSERLAREKWALSGHDQDAVVKRRKLRDESLKTPDAGL